MLRVNLALVSVQSEVESDPQARALAESTWPQLISSLGDCQDAATFVRLPPQPPDVAAGSNTDSEVPPPPVATSAVRDEVFKYLQAKDRYAALTSVLLKSRAFHLANAPPSEEDSGCSIPVVRLPRTVHNKPYLPGSVGPPINVSHQHPFVGIAAFCTRIRGGPSSSLSTPLQVGLDIVVFDDYNRQLYASAWDFVDVFRDNLTEREWTFLDSLKDDETRLMREFFLRWAVKEAYTKALGMGLGHDFAAFEVAFDCDDGKEEPRSSSLGGYCDCFQRSLAASGAPRLRPATVLLSGGRESRWRFGFVPLDLPKREAPQSHRNRWPLGCACVCLGPLASCDSLESEIPVSVEWLDFERLIRFHAGRQAINGLGLSMLE